MSTEIIYPLIVVGASAALMALYSIAFRYRLNKRQGGTPRNQAQQRFTSRFVAVAIAGAVLVGLVILAFAWTVWQMTVWQGVAIYTAFCAAVIPLLMWYERRLMALADRN